MDIDKAPHTSIDRADRIEDSEVDREFLERLPLKFLKKNMVFPLGVSGGVLAVACAVPSSLYALDEISSLLSVKVKAVLTTPKEVLDAIHRHCERPSGTAEEAVNSIGAEGLEAFAHRWEEPKDLLELSDEAPVIRLLNSLLFQAVKERASDIHIEPYERELDVRFRRDGVLYTVITPPKQVQEALASRVKVMAGLNIAEKRLAQDGRIRLLVAGHDIDVRVSTVPTTFGERVVLRLLDRKGGSVALSDLGLGADSAEELASFLSRTNGMVLVTGPTGSGKTTTLYACLNRLDSRRRNVITIEDPVEYQLRGVGQIQVNTKAGITFASGLRSILRQDPDIIMVGEIRDPETADMAIQASLTGHLVLSTLHTNDAPSAVTRLVDMGIQPFLLSSSLCLVVAQRLVRTLCPHCREEYMPDAKELSFFSGACPERLWKANGCQKCLGTGYSGQTGIFELMKVTPELKSLIMKSSESAALRQAAVSNGMRTLMDDGLSKAALGVTTVEEVLRVAADD